MLIRFLTNYYIVLLPGVPVPVPVPPGVPVPVPVRLDNPQYLSLYGLYIGNYIKTLRTQYY